MELLRLTHRLDQMARELFAEEETSGLTLRQAVLLATIGEHPHAALTDLVHLTGVDRSTMSDVIRRLKRRGLIRCKRARHDARAYSVDLTDAGLKALAHALAASRQAEKRLAGRVSGLQHVVIHEPPPRRWQIVGEVAQP